MGGNMYATIIFPAWSVYSAFEYVQREVLGQACGDVQSRQWTSEHVFVSMATRATSRRHYSTRSWRSGKKTSPEFYEDSPIQIDRNLSS